MPGTKPGVEANEEMNAAEPDDALYAIDFDSFEKAGRSAAFAARARRCWQCLQLLDDEGVYIGELSEHMAEIADCCSRKADYVLPGTPLTEAVFRLMLAEKNRPLSLRDIQERLSAAWSSVIYMKDLSDDLLRRLLESENEYFIRRVA